MTGLELLAIDYRTLFVLDESGRIVRENDPDRSPGPRFWLARCEQGHIAGARSDVADDVAAALMALAAAEPLVPAGDGDPAHLDRYAALLSGGSAPPERGPGLIYELPHGLRREHDATLVDSETEAGQRLCDSFRDRGMPTGLVELGYRDASDLWPPWCLALHGGEVASVACAARLSEEGAELGLATVRAFRGRGYAAAAAAGWSALPSLRSRALFYSTDRANTSSRRVIDRLGLRPLGSSLRLT